MLHQVAQLCGLDMPKVAAEKMSSNFKTKTARAEMTQAQRLKSFYRIESKAKNAITKKDYTCLNHDACTVESMSHFFMQDARHDRKDHSSVIQKTSIHKAESTPPAAQSIAQAHPILRSIYLNPHVSCCLNS